MGSDPVRRFGRGGAAVEQDHTVVDVHHVGGFDERVVEVLVLRVERMIDFERSAGLP